MVALDPGSSELEALGPEVSWTKTKIEEFMGLLEEPVQSVCAWDKNLKVTESFT